METSPATTPQPALPAEQSPPARRTRPWSVLRSGAFVRLLVANNLSLLGDFFSYIALSWLVLQLTTSSLALGGVLVVQAVPRSVLMLVGGALADRISARLTMAGSMALRVAVAGTLAILVIGGRVQMWEVYTAAAIFGIVDAFFIPGRSSITPRVVEDHELEPANALLNISSQVCVIAGPALAGVVIAAYGTGWSFALDAACFAAGLPFVLSLPGGRPQTKAEQPKGDARPKSGGMLADIVAGLRYAWSDVGLRATLVFIAAMDFAANGALGVGLPTLAHGRFSAGATGLGILFAAWGLGATIGAAGAGLVPPPRRFGLLVIGVAAWLGVGVVALGFTPSLPPAAVIVAVASFGSGAVNTYGISWLQRRTSADMQGRVVSLVMLASVGLVPIGFAVSGALAQLNPTILFVAAGGLMLLTAVGSAASRTVRAL